MPSLAVSVTSAAAPTPVAGAQTIGTGMPTGASPDAMGNSYGLNILYFDPNGTQKTATVMLGKANPIAATAGIIS
jgi:hypothetical protein